MYTGIKYYEYFNINITKKYAIILYCIEYIHKTWISSTALYNNKYQKKNSVAWMEKSPRNLLNRKIFFFKLKITQKKALKMKEKKNHDKSAKERWMAEEKRQNSTKFHSSFLFFSVFSFIYSVCSFSFVWWQHSKSKRKIWKKKTMVKSFAFCIILHYFHIFHFAAFFLSLCLF